MNILVPVWKLNSGDYLDIPNLQSGVGIAGTVSQVNRICGTVWSLDDSADAIAINPATLCSYTTPFRVGVHFDSDDVINAAAANLADNIENAAPTGIAGIGYNGFYMAYWQNTCAWDTWD